MSRNVPAIAVALSLVGAMFITGCSSTPDAEPGKAPSLRSGTESNVVVWLAPKAILEDVLHPPGSCNQHFVLTDRDMAWHIEFPLEGYAHAGFVLRKTNDLSSVQARASLRLRFNPGYEANHYRAALVDSHGTLISLPLVRKVEVFEPGWIEVRLPLNSFPERGLNTTSKDLQTGVIFDWSTIREFRLMGNGRRSATHVEVGVLRIVEE